MAGAPRLSHGEPGPRGPVPHYRTGRAASSAGSGQASTGIKAGVVVYEWHPGPPGDLAGLSP
jgi:hypothetical protein